MICRALRRAIIEQALEPGAKLPEDSLGERFGVSRTMARYALGQLASEGLVELRRNRIAVVVTPSWQDARDIWSWLEEGAHIYVCGDAKGMAPDVNAALLAIIAGEGGRSPEDAQDYLRDLIEEHRYNRDVY